MFLSLLVDQRMMDRQTPDVLISVSLNLNILPEVDNDGMSSDKKMTVSLDSRRDENKHKDRPPLGFIGSEKKEGGTIVWVYIYTYTQSVQAQHT